MVRMGKGGGQEMEETKRMQGEWAGEISTHMNQSSHMYAGSSQQNLQSAHCMKPQHSSRLE